MAPGHFSSRLAGSVERPEPAQIGGTGAHLIDAPDAPLAAEHAVIDVVLVDAMAKAGRTHFEMHGVTAMCR